MRTSTVGVASSLAVFPAARTPSEWFAVLRQQADAPEHRGLGGAWDAATELLATTGEVRLDRVPNTDWLGRPTMPARDRIGGIGERRRRRAMEAFDGVQRAAQRGDGNVRKAARSLTNDTRPLRTFVSYDMGSERSAFMAVARLAGRAHVATIVAYDFMTCGSRDFVFFEPPDPCDYLADAAGPRTFDAIGLIDLACAVLEARARFLDAVASVHERDAEWQRAMIELLGLPATWLVGDLAEPPPRAVPDVPLPDAPLRALPRETRAGPRGDVPQTSEEDQPQPSSSVAAARRPGR